MQDAIQIKGLTFAYGEQSKVLDELSLNIKKGAYCAILGRNGSGKSTLAKIITGLLEYQSGEVIVNGLTVNPQNIYQIRSHVGIVFQNPDNQFIGATVCDDIAFGLENRQIPQIEMDAIIQEFSFKTGMHKYLDKEPANLSGGQKQRVAIAGVLAMRPDIMIFDEATSMLDPRGKRDIKSVIMHLREESPETTILSITHDIEEALLADEVIILGNGKVVMQGKPQEIFSQVEQVRYYGLDIPFVFKLKNLLAQAGLAYETIDIEKMVELICK